jgi:head-tail adaptor
LKGKTLKARLLASFGLAAVLCFAAIAGVCFCQSNDVRPAAPAVSIQPDLIQKPISDGGPAVPDQVILREMILVEKQGPNAPVDAGGHVDGLAKNTWIKHCDRRAEVKSIGVREQQSPDGKQVKAQTVFRVKVRWDLATACIKPKMRVNWLTAIGGARTLNIVGAFDPEGERRVIFLDCVAQTA